MAVTRGQEIRALQRYAQEAAERRMANSRRGMGRQWRKHYKIGDTAHRHRIEDAQPKEEVVTTYRRRKA